MWLVYVLAIEMDSFLGLNQWPELISSSVSSEDLGVFLQFSKPKSRDETKNI